MPYSHSVQNYRFQIAKFQNKLSQFSPLTVLSLFLETPLSRFSPARSVVNGKFALSQFFFEPLRHDTDDLVVRLTFLAAHMAGASDDAQVFWATVLRQQV